MEIITVTEENIECEHICCAISNNSDCQVRSKKDWLSARFADGLVFKKGDVRGKCFIEYIPAENAWAPIEAEGYMYIDCLWVSGQFKGHGNSTLLLNECIEDSRRKGKRGLVALSSKKKQAFLSDPKYLRYKGFKLADSALPSYELLYLPFDESAPVPRFKEQAKTPHIEEKGFVLYYAHQCPYPAKYVPIIAEIAKQHGAPFRTVLLETKEQAQSAPAPFATYSLFYDGELVTHEILSDKKFEKLLAEKGFTASFEQARADEPKTLAELSALAISIWKPYYDPIVGAEQNDYMISAFLTPEAIARHISGGERWFFVRSGGENAGFMVFYPKDGKLYLSKLYLDEAYRGKGLSRQMLQFALDAARAEGLCAIELNVNKHNDGSIAVYRHLGFTQTRAEKNDIGGGFYMDDYVFEYTIE